MDEEQKSKRNRKLLFGKLIDTIMELDRDTAVDLLENYQTMIEGGVMVKAYEEGYMKRGAVGFILGVASIMMMEANEKLVGYGIDITDKGYNKTLGIEDENE